MKSKDIGYIYGTSQGTAYFIATDKDGNEISGPLTINIDEKMSFCHDKIDGGIKVDYVPHSKNEFIDGSKVVAEYKKDLNPEEFKTIQELFKELEEDNKTIEVREDDIRQSVKELSENINNKYKEWHDNGIKDGEPQELFNKTCQDMMAIILEQLKINILKEVKKGGK